MKIDQSKCNCYENMILYVGDFFKKDVNLYFLNTFGFAYVTDGIQIDQHCVLNKSSISFSNELLWEYCGIRTAVIENNENNPTRDPIQCMEGKNRIIGLRLNEEDEDNFVIYLGECDGVYKYQNLYRNREINVIPARNFDTQVIQYFVFEDYGVGFEPKGLDDVVLFLRTYINCSKDEYLKALNRFARDIDLFAFSSDVTVSHLIRSKFIFGLSNVSWSRYNFACALDHAKNLYQTHVFDQVISKLLQCHKCWELVKNYVVKSFFIKEKLLYRKKIADLLLLIIEMESDMTHDLISLH